MYEAYKGGRVTNDHIKMKGEKKLHWNDILIIFQNIFEHLAITLPIVFFIIIILVTLAERCHIKRYKAENN